MNEEQTLSETEEELYNFLKQKEVTPMFYVKKHENKKLIGAIGKLKRYGLIEIIRRTVIEEPRKEYRKVIRIVKEE